MTSETADYEALQRQGQDTKIMREYLRQRFTGERTRSLTRSQIKRCEAVYENEIMEPPPEPANRRPLSNQ